ncbi:MAG: DUF4390 domain-containing protein [Rhodoferax sp.]|nr:DUF4390 domain-containing protein [Rhodoferax sp.]
MTDFFTLYCKNALNKRALQLFLIVATLFSSVAHAQVVTEISQLRVGRSDAGWQLSAQLQFELPQAVEDALLKGIPMVFVMNADVLKERWYWYDKKQTTAERRMRLAYQPLMRRWRLNIITGSATNSGTGLTLNQSFDTLAQAQSAIKRIVNWKIADAGDMDLSGKYKLDFRFRLDLGQLPRPFQIGAIGQSEWDISASILVPLVADSGK